MPISLYSHKFYCEGRLTAADLSISDKGPETAICYVQIVLKVLGGLINSEDRSFAQHHPGDGKNNRKTEGVPWS